MENCEYPKFDSYYIKDTNVNYYLSIIWHSQNSLSFVLVDENQYVLGCCMAKKDDKGIFLYNFSSSIPNKGYGSILLREITDFFTSHKITPIQAKIEENNTHSQHIFEKIGYKHIEDNPASFIGYTLTNNKKYVYYGN